MKKKLIVTASLVIIATFMSGLNIAASWSFGGCFFGKKMPVDKKETGKEITLHIEGMTCTVCNISVNTALKKLDGVIDAKADYKKKNAWVRYDEKKVTPEDMLKAIKDIGFKPSLPTSSK